MKFVDAAGSYFKTPSWVSKKVIAKAQAKEANNERTKEGKK